MGSTNVGAVNNTPVTLSQVVPPPRQSRLANTFNARTSPPANTRRGAPSRPPPSDRAGDDHDEAEDPADTEDKQIYCFCRKLSYGEVSRTCSLIIYRLRPDMDGALGVP